MSDKPNILLIMADQLAAQALQLYGNQICKTPNLDRLAGEGAVFTNNYSNNPLCVPSRASMLTGKLSPDIDVYDNANEIASSKVDLPDPLSPTIKVLGDLFSCISVNLSPVERKFFQRTYLNLIIYTISLF